MEGLGPFEDLSEFLDMEIDDTKVQVQSLENGNGICSSGTSGPGSVDMLFPPLPQLADADQGECINDGRTHDLLTREELSLVRSYLHCVIPEMFPFASLKDGQEVCFELEKLARESKIGLSLVFGPAIRWRHSQLQHYGFPEWSGSEEKAASHEQILLEWLQHMHNTQLFLGKGAYTQTSVELAQVCIAQLLLRHVSTLELNNRSR